MRKLDHVFVEGLPLEAVIGILPDESVRKQTILLDIDCRLATKKAALSGRLEDTVDYGLATERLRALAASRSWGLLETLAEDSAKLLMEEFSMVELTLTIRKPQALGGGGVPGVRIRRTR